MCFIQFYLSFEAIEQDFEFWQIFLSVQNLLV